MHLSISIISCSPGSCTDDAAVSVPFSFFLEIQFVAGALAHYIGPSVKTIVQIQIQCPSGLRMILFRLREALELVESCGRRPAFDDADKRINNYLIELSSGSGASIEKKIDRLARGPVASQDHQQTSGKITIFFSYKILLILHRFPHHQAVRRGCMRRSFRRPTRWSTLFTVFPDTTLLVPVTSAPTTSQILQ
jgi:hypothetical protein